MLCYRVYAVSPADCAHKNVRARWKIVCWHIAGLLFARVHVNVCIGSRKVRFMHAAPCMCNIAISNRWWVMALCMPRTYPVKIDWMRQQHNRMYDHTFNGGFNSIVLYYTIYTHIQCVHVWCVWCMCVFLFDSEQLTQLFVQHARAQLILSYSSIETHFSNTPPPSAAE